MVLCTASVQAVTALVTLIHSYFVMCTYFPSHTSMIVTKMFVYRFLDNTDIVLELVVRAYNSSIIHCECVSKQQIT